MPSHLHELGGRLALARYYVSLSCILPWCTTARLCLRRRADQLCEAVLFRQIARAHGHGCDRVCEAEGEVYDQFRFRRHINVSELLLMLMLELDYL